MKTLTPARLPTQGIVFPESPRWRDGKLWFSDMFGNRVMTVDERGNTQTVVEVEGPSGLGFLPDGGLLIATRTSGLLWRLDTDGLRKVVDLNAFATRGLNDMVVDAQGRAYVDAYRLGPGLPTGSIVLVRPDGTTREVAPGLITPNGLVITPDGGTLIAGQTGANELTAFTIRPDGSLSDRWTFAQLDGKPDGICLDAEGAVWVAQFEDGKFVRVREGGDVTHRVSMPGARTVAVMLGGRDRRTLFLCASVIAPGEPSQRSRANAKGSIYSVQAPVAGAGWP